MSRNFAKRHLKDTTFTRMNFSRCDFTRAKLDGVKFIGCSLAFAKFHGAKMRNCSFECCDLSGASFRYAIMADTAFTSNAMYETCLYRAKSGLTRVSPVGDGALPSAEELYYDAHSDQVVFGTWVGTREDFLLHVYSRTVRESGASRTDSIILTTLARDLMPLLRVKYRQVNLLSLVSKFFPPHTNQNQTSHKPCHTA